MKEIAITTEMWPDVFKLSTVRGQLNKASEEYTTLMKMMGIPLSANFEVHPDKAKIFYEERESKDAETKES